MAEPMGLVLAVIVCLTTGTKGEAQKADTVSSVQVALSVAHAPKGTILRLGEASRLEGTRLVVSRAVLRPPSNAAPKHSALKWGVSIGAIVGFAGGALQPTHSNGDYVLGSNRFTSSLVLGGIGAGVGALIGLAIEKGRN
ncbi:MAG TPA: hypothetical protein VES67_10415 [Vicinamibacterales bacterium]|nr:hypothetical protein [Vicinamibacterales bacterium]